MQNTWRPVRTVANVLLVVDLLLSYPVNVDFRCPDFLENNRICMFFDKVSSQNVHFRKVICICDSTKIWLAITIKYRKLVTSLTMEEAYILAWANSTWTTSELGCSIYLNLSFCIQNVMNFDVGVLCCYSNVWFHMTDVQSYNAANIYFMILAQLLFLYTSFSWFWKFGKILHFMRLQYWKFLFSEFLFFSSTSFPYLF